MDDVKNPIGFFHSNKIPKESGRPGATSAGTGGTQQHHACPYVSGASAWTWAGLAEQGKSETSIIPEIDVITIIAEDEITDVSRLGERASR